jgi:hypothetical protein
MAAKTKVRASLGFALLAILIRPTTLFAAEPAISHCIFANVHSSFFGTCPILDEVPHLAISKQKIATGGVLEPNEMPFAIFRGEMSDRGSRQWPVQLQIYKNHSGVLQTIYGWFPVTNYRLTSATLSFSVNGQLEVAPNALDVRIVRRASEILSSPIRWNRHDNRECSPTAITYSIYCAAEKAVEEVTGGTGLIDHRRPALEVIRELVEDRVKNRNYHHRLMDYNNDHTTTITDVRSLFDESLRVMADKVWLQAHGFATKIT